MYFILFLSNSIENIKKLIYDRILFLYEKDIEFTFIIEEIKQICI